MKKKYSVIQSVEEMYKVYDVNNVTQMKEAAIVVASKSCDPKLYQHLKKLQDDGIPFLDLRHAHYRTNK